MNFSRSKKIISLVLIVVFCAGYFVINAIAQGGQNRNIDILMEYKSGTEFDPDDDGIETIGNVIDFTVENSVFNWGVSETNLCTKWNVNSGIKETAICYGGEECCSFVELNSTSGNWNDIFYLNYGRHGSSYSNTISAQVIYVNYSIDPENPYEEIVYSIEQSLSANFEKRNVKISTKIEDFTLVPNTVSKGEIADVSARLYKDTSRFSHQELGVYVDGNLAGTDITDTVGYIDFSLDTSSLTTGEHSVEIKFLGNEVSSEEEITTYLPSSSGSKILLVEGGNESVLSSNIQFIEIKDCDTVYWETEEPVYDICQREKMTTVCDDEPINKSCHDEIVYHNYTCKTGIQTVQHSKEVCKPNELRITRGNEEGRINFGNWGKCGTEEEGNSLIVICDSRYDGNNDGICQSGESCVKFVVTEQGVQRSLKNSQEEFTIEDESFFLEKLDYEVMTE